MLEVTWQSAWKSLLLQQLGRPNMGSLGLLSPQRGSRQGSHDVWHIILLPNLEYAGDRTENWAFHNFWSRVREQRDWATARFSVGPISFLRWQFNTDNRLIRNNVTIQRAGEGS